MQGLAQQFCCKGGVLNYARTIVAELLDCEVLHSCLFAVPNGFKNGVDHRLERGPVIEWGHGASIHGRPRNTVSMDMIHEAVL